MLPLALEGLAAPDARPGLGLQRLPMHVTAAIGGREVVGPAHRSRHLEHRNHGAEGARLPPRHQPLGVVRSRRIAKHVHPELLPVFDTTHQPKPSPQLGHRHSEQAREAAHHRDCRPAVGLGRAGEGQLGKARSPGPFIDSPMRLIDSLPIWVARACVWLLEE